MSSGARPKRTTTRDREALLDRLTPSARLAFVAFCAQRCIDEAARHHHTPHDLLAAGLGLLWSAAEGAPVDLTRVAAIEAHVDGYEGAHPSGEAVTWASDFTLVQAARVVARGLRALRDPAAATPQKLVGALDGPAILIATIHEDAMGARAAEVAVIDAALLRLEAATTPASPVLFSGLPEWPRGALTARYAKGRLVDSTADDESE